MLRDHFVQDDSVVEDDNESSVAPPLSCRAKRSCRAEMEMEMELELVENVLFQVVREMGWVK